MVSLKTERSALAGRQVAVPADIAGINGISGCTETDIPAAGNLRCFTEAQSNVPAVNSAAAVIRNGHIQLVT